MRKRPPFQLLSTFLPLGFHLERRTEAPAQGYYPNAPIAEFFERPYHYNGARERKVRAFFLWFSKEKKKCFTTGRTGLYLVLLTVAALLCATAI